MMSQDNININIEETNDVVNIVSSEITEVIDLNVYEITEEVTLNITEEIVQVNINKVTSTISENLQQVTDNGSHTNNSITVENGNYYSIIEPYDIGTANNDTGKYSYIGADGILGIKTNQQEGQLKTTNLIDSLILEFPDKNGSKTIATIDDIPNVSGLATTTYVDTQDALKVDKVAGYSLTKNDLTDALKTAYDNAVNSLTTLLSTGSRLITSAEITKLSNTTGVNTGDQDLSGKIDKVTGKSLIADSEITRLATVTNFDNSANVAALANKVDKVTGKGLSTEDYTTSEKTKVSNLSGINSGDETTTTIKSKLGITTLSGSNTGDQDLSGLTPKTTTINSKPLSSNITLNTDDVAENGTPTNKWWTNARTIASTLTSFTSGAGTVSASDTILQAIQKIVGNIALKMDLSTSAYSLMANNTNASANAVAQVFKAIAKQTYSGTITWTGTTAPSGTTNHSYSWQQIGNLVTLTINLVYGTQGTALTIVTCTLPTDCPNPIKPDGLTNASEKLYVGLGQLNISSTSVSLIIQYCTLRSNSGNNGFEILLQAGAQSYKSAQLTIQYFTS